MATAILLGQNQLQMDGDFRCMEKHVSALDYAAGAVDGVSPGTDYKSPRAVWIESTVAGPPIVTTLQGPLLKVTEGEALEIRATAFRQRGLTTLPAEYCDRWFERERKVCLLQPPAAGIKLRVDYYCVLPAYAVDGSTDYFSEFLWPVLLYAAAWLGSTSLWEDDRAAQFQSSYIALLARAIAKDQQIKSGLTAADAGA
jgi:hypothetical protein